MIKALALVSGGLDSLLAARLIKEQGIGVIGLHFRIPFCKKGTQEALSDAGIELREVSLGDEFLEIVKKPRHGFGSNMNPCIDCKILMLRKAKELMRQWDAEFIITGEVLGQRPMSQNRQALDLIERESGLQGLLLRPLCAQLLAETTPEKEGWIIRDKLLAFNGRGRKPQVALAEKLKINNYQQPAGGCLLTDPSFSKRVKDLIGHKELNVSNVELLKLGRHFRISSGAKLVVGRDEGENQELFNAAGENDYLFFPDECVAGPTALGRGTFNADLIRLSAGIVCGYCDLCDKKEADIIYKKAGNGPGVSLKIPPMDKSEIIRLRL